MRNHFYRPRLKRPSMYARSATALLLVVPLFAACDLDELLEVDDPFTVTPEVARDTTNLINTFAGARAQFGVAVGGIQNDWGGVVMHSGLASDELYSTDNFNNRWALDRRNFDYEQSNSESDQSFVFLQRARSEALNAAGLFAQTSQSGSQEHAELFSIAGFSALMLAENFCSGIPLSRVTENGDFEYGIPLETAQVYDRAIEHFDEAIAVAAGDARQTQIASIGKARALLGKGEFAAAADAAADVPDGFFPYLAEFSGANPRTWNAVWQFNWDERRISASLQEGTVNQGLPFGSTVDPRTPIDPVPVQANTGTTPVYLELKYEDADSDIPIASAYEARYIQAEAALQGGDLATYRTMMNQARMIQGLGPLNDQELGINGSEADRVDVLFRERAYAMWLTGHRFSDLRRLVRQYGRDAGEVFPTGMTPNGQTYGTDLSFPIPFEEVNNPEFTGCISTAA
jgi:starch-binding outer membrane protein, SusD/RagB family